jgi:hypothetical protein
MRVYFAHPVSDYGSRYEQECLERIKEEFPEANIVNPNSSIYEDNYRCYGMKYFEDLAANCDVVVAAPFRDGHFGMGVWRELDAAGRGGNTVCVISPNNISEVDYRDVVPLSINETRRRIRAT